MGLVIHLLCFAVLENWNNTNTFPKLAEVEEQALLLDQERTSTRNILFVRLHGFERHMWRVDVSQ